MLKVIIADDEARICQLIVKLIDWTALEMEIVFIASNGFETMNAIKEHKPELVITDIRMPGMDGLELIKNTRELGLCTEFIIISGYRHFEYAQKAIRYGVGDYLLKPIKKEALTQTLTTLRDKYREKYQLITYEERVKLVIKNDAGRLRTTYFSSILYENGRTIQQTTIEEINNQYHFHFMEGLFQIIGIKFDNISTDRQNLNFIADKTDYLVQLLFKDHCFDYETYIEGSFIYLLLNYSEDVPKLIRKQLKTLISEFLILESIFAGMEVTIGSGQPVHLLDQLSLCLDESRKLIFQRLVCGSGKVISEGALPASGLSESELFYTFNRDMTVALESFDIEQIKSVLVHLKKGLKSNSAVTGYEILQMTKETCNLFLFSMKNQKLIIEDSSGFVETFSAKAAGCSNIDTLFELLEHEISSSYLQAVENKKLEDGRPIRIAKSHIREHYMLPLTLDEVSAIAGFSPPYFSTLFKKETGTSFLEYLSCIRMDEAKRLLKESSLNISTICNQVGYSDVKYFTKNFIKATGLKPSEYRKIYS